MNILLLERLAAEALKWLQSQHEVRYQPALAYDAAALRSTLMGVHAVLLPRKVPVTRELLGFAPQLRALARMHPGTEETDLEACRQRNVRVIQATSAHLRAKAEYLLAALLLLFRRGIATAVAGSQPVDIRLGRELQGSVIGILGLDPTAYTLVPLLQALGARLIGYDPAVHHTGAIWGRLQVQPVGLSQLLTHADAVSVQVIYGSRYEGFINDKVLAHCKPGQVWASVSRSKLFDPAALAHALKDGRIDAAMLDGADTTLVAPGSPLHGLPNLFLTPRLAAHTREARLRASWYVAQRLHEALSLPQQLNPQGDAGGAEHGANAPDDASATEPAQRLRAS